MDPIENTGPDDELDNVQAGAEVDPDTLDDAERNEIAAAEAAA